MAKTLDPIVFLGNPVPHRPINVGGEQIGHKPVFRHKETGVCVETAEAQAAPDEHEPMRDVETVWHVQEDMVPVLRAHVADIEEASSENFRARVREAARAGLPLEDWELACGHALIAVAGHAHEGVSWVAASDQQLQAALAALFDADQAPKGTADALKLAQLQGGEDDDWGDITASLHGPTALKTEEGVEVVANASFGTSAQPAALNYVALTANATAPAAADKTLTGEIVTAGGGLIRKQGGYLFTKATGVLTLTTTFTANASDALPVTIEKFGIFNKSVSGGVMGVETKLSSSVTLKAENDNMTITETITIT